MIRKIPPRPLTNQKPEFCADRPVVAESYNHGYALELKVSSPMQTTYRLNASELDEKFLEGLKTTFQGQEIEIIVYALDETEYLLSSPANRERLLAAKANVEQGESQVTVELGELE